MWMLGVSWPMGRKYHADLWIPPQGTSYAVMRSNRPVGFGSNAIGSGVRNRVAFLNQAHGKWFADYRSKIQRRGMPR